MSTPQSGNTKRSRYTRFAALALLIAALCWPVGATASAATPQASVTFGTEAGPLGSSVAPPANGQTKPAVQAATLTGRNVYSWGPYNIQPNNSWWAESHCPSGTLAVGGGESNDKIGVLTLRDTFALNGGSGWRLRINNLSSVDANVRIYLVCVSGVANYTQVTGKAAVSPGGSVGVFASCPSGLQLLGGGGSSEIWNTKIYSVGELTFNRWLYSTYNYDSATQTVIAQAVCGNNVANQAERSGSEIQPAPGQSGTSLAVCPPGTQVLSGGGYTSNGQQIRLTDSYPEGEGWRVYFHNDNVSVATHRAYVLCGA